MSHYFNENDPQMAAWLRELMRDGLIADGVIDERSICDVQGCDLEGFVQCHFFAGIGGWSRALRLAGWSDDRPVWTGSCPCQDFSHCGKRSRFEGSRDLWPVWFNLIRERRPEPLFGEQVDDSPEWYDRTHTDLESIDYAVAACVIPGCAVGAKQERYRIYFAADATKVDGQPHDCVAQGRNGRPSPQLRGLPRLEVAGRWWRAHPGAERMPTLVRNFNGLSVQLGGFGNAIVPSVGAAFIQAFEEVRSPR